MPIPLRIAIVGSGTAGPAAALFLARAGHEVTLFERAAQTLPVGAGFLLQPTGLTVLHHLGLTSELLPHTAPITKLYCRTRDGRVLLNLSYQELGQGLHGAGTHRATLLEVLLKALPQAGVRVQWDTAMQRLSRDSSGRPSLHDSHGHTHGPYDLLLICDGANSTLRAQSGVPARVSRYPWGALWFIGQRTPEFQPDVLWQCVHTTRQLNGYLPTGTRDDLLSLFWSIRLDQIPHWKDQPLALWKKQILTLAPQAESFLAQIHTHDQIATAAYHDVKMRHWHGDRVVLLGDAAHALSPQLGQGVNLALMDAATLADSLAKYPLDQALPHYSATRRRHLLFYQFATRWTTPFFQSGLLPLGWLRDLAFPLLHTLPIMRRQMTATMAGGKTGPFSAMKFAPPWAP
ncbi:2-polyprenyl-6-methoxyphenol hydroxylase-like FAD-dependent oxidoreductase [Prosthecobacter fusiformis]|uniref:2-polyprenyl-6-methoxyphenol hydroxylase-like FAD-dependent oxidoreductase n=1 Tax=Prosthecobacter fusiformis TaxID=48464 RepID=A0A4R7SQE1_9BACT|nr:NAD(P)/FAD-dependent oxidoreductase [Prosthecobacter fusiformis]TDU80855.1 2-polyprenyl-6-methoxyphenol hydroxylase-like FAD-dependent oxidoreductase [Prosthecobacter fusiformis]